MILLLLITGTMPFLRKPVAVEVQEHAAAEKSANQKALKTFLIALIATAFSLAKKRTGVKLTDLLDKRSIYLESCPDSKQETLEKAIALMIKSGNICEAESYHRQVYLETKKGRKHMRILISRR